MVMEQLFVNVPPSSGEKRNWPGKIYRPLTVDGCRVTVANYCSFFKGLPPLWMRQIPYTMMKFAAFERTVEFLYKYVVPVPRDQLSKPKQLVVTFAAGYIAGVFCAIVSHPADSVVSKLNSNKGSTAWQAAKDLGMIGESSRKRVETSLYTSLPMQGYVMHTISL